MNRHTVVKLGVGTAFAIVLALWATSTRNPADQATLAGQPLLKGLRESINDVKQVRIIEAGNKTAVTLNRGADGWTVAERGDYAADIAKVRETLINFAEAKITEGKTSNPERYPVLGVEDVTKPEAKGMRVEIDGKVNAKLVIGIFSTQGSGTFVRRNDEAQSWLVKGNLVLDRQAAGWLAKDLVDIASDRIMRVEITRDGGTFSISKTSPEQGNFVIDNLPAGREAVSEYEPNGIASVLAGLRFDDVVKDSAAPPVPADAITAKYHTFDGLVIEIHGYTADGKSYASINASVDASRADIAANAAQLNAVADHRADTEATASATQPDGATSAVAKKPAAVEPPAVADPAAFIAAERKKVDEEAAKLNQRAQGWVYVLPAFKYANINKRLEDLLKPKG